MQSLLIERKGNPVEFSYPIVWEDGFKAIGSHLDMLGLSAKKACIAADSRVASLYLQELSDALKDHFRQVDLFVFPEGESSKNLETVQKLYEFLIQKKYERRDLLIALIALKYTQSNSVCYAKDGQAIGIGAGQQSRIHCTRLAGNKADVWYLRQHPKVLALPFKEKIRRADRDNTIDVYISDEYMDVLADGAWENFFTEKPEILTAEEKKEWLSTFSGVSVGSDAFFPFGDNIERAHKSGVQYIAEPGGSIRDDHVIATCNTYNMVMAFTAQRLFHH